MFQIKLKPLMPDANLYRAIWQLDPFIRRMNWKIRFNKQQKILL